MSMRTPHTAAVCRRLDTPLVVCVREWLHIEMTLDSGDCLPGIADFPSVLLLSVLQLVKVTHEAMHNEATNANNEAKCKLDPVMCHTLPGQNHSYLIATRSQPFL